ncbi:MAG TPA: histidine kinase N-terminal 7TM domain-containing protein, partial [Herpetosiphonaceae bacterium]
MNWQYTPYLFPVLGAGAISTTLAVIASRKRTSVSALPFMAMMIAVAYWSFCYAIELSSTQLATKVLWSKIMYPGIAITPATWLIFALYQTGRGHWFTRRNWWWWTIEPIAVIALAWTNNAHRMIWTDNRLVQEGGIVVQVVDHGPLFWVHAVYSYVGIALGSFFLIKDALGAGGLLRSQTWLMLVAISAPWIGNALYLSGLSPSNLDLTPFAFTLTGLGLAAALFRFGLLEIVPIARSRVVDTISDGVLVLDSDHRLVDINPAAAAVIGRPISELIGQPS